MFGSFMGLITQAQNGPGFRTRGRLFRPPEPVDTGILLTRMVRGRRNPQGRVEHRVEASRTVQIVAGNFEAGYKLPPPPPRSLQGSSESGIGSSDCHGLVPPWAATGPSPPTPTPHPGSPPIHKSIKTIHPIPDQDPDPGSLREPDPARARIMDAPDSAPCAQGPGSVGIAPDPGPGAGPDYGRAGSGVLRSSGNPEKTRRTRTEHPDLPLISYRY